MITNNILLKLKDRNSENIENARDKLLSMKDKIESLRDLTVKVNIRQDASSYDILQIAQYDSMESFIMYISKYTDMADMRKPPQSYVMSVRQENKLPPSFEGGSKP